MAYTVSFVSLDGCETVSRCFSTLRASRKWAAWLVTRSFAVKAKIYRGPAGSELLEEAAAR